LGPRYLHINHAQTALWERPGLDPPILLCHATGFHARSWDAIVELVPGRRCIAMDMRGHGRSTKPEPPISWRMFGTDVAEVASQLNLRGAIAVGHSMGGHSIVLAAALAPDAFSQLLLLDPVILPEAAYTGPITEPHFARKRRNRWTSWHEMLDRFRSRPPFNRWNERVLRDYCEYALLPAPDGDGLVLACPPEVEGSIYEQSRARESNIYPEIAAVRIPVTIVRAAAQRTDAPAMDMNASPTAPGLASQFAQAEDVVVEHSHFIPMEAPEFVADRIARMLVS
jgi:lipase